MSFHPDLQAELSQMARNHGVRSDDHDPLRPPIAAFDWDDTSIHGDISHELLELLDHEDPRGRVEEYRRHCDRDLYGAYRQLVHTLVAGRTPEEVARLAERALARGLERGTLALRPEMHALVSELQAEGWWVRVVTASPTPVVRPLARRYGIPPEHVLGIRSAVDGGRFLPQLVDPVPIAGGKMDTLLDHTERSPLFTTGDSWSDHALMSVSRYVLLHHRGDDSLLQEARQRGWWVVGEEQG